VKRLAFSEDSKVLASSGATIRLWDVASGDLLDSLPSSQTWRPFFFSADGSTLIEGHDKQIKRWKLDEQQNPRIHRLPEGDSISAISPDFEMAAMATESGRIEVWNIATDAEVSQFSHGAPVFRLTWTARRQIATAGKGGKINIWNVDTGELVETLTHEDALNSLAFSPHNRLLATGSPNGTISIWDRSFESPRRKVIQSHEPGNTVQRLAFSSDGRLMVSATKYRFALSVDGKERSNVKLWDPVTGELIHSFPEFPASSLAFSADSSTLAFGTYNSEVILWDVDKKRERVRLSGNDGTVMSICFSQDGRQLFLGDQHTLKTWDLGTNKIQFELETGGDGVRFLAVTPDSRTVFTASKHDFFKIWRSASEDEVQQIRKRWHEIQERK